MAKRDTTTAKGTCRCEATVAASILEGFACGNPECWRTAPAQASFDAFLTDLIARRVPEPKPERVPSPEE
jgi:hypothetical protein